MNEAQRTHWEMVGEIDRDGRGLAQWEVELVAGLIDNDCEGKLSVADMARIRAIHRRRVTGDPDEGDD